MMKAFFLRLATVFALSLQVAALPVSIAVAQAPMIPAGGSVLPACRGGTVTSSGGLIIHDFTAGGTLVCNYPVFAQWLAIGSGGAGGTASAGSGAGGGGGGGDVVSGSGALAAGSYPVVVGASVTANNPGNSSSFNGTTAVGGGEGGHQANGGNGSSGGGGGGGGGLGGTGSGTHGFNGGNNSGSGGNAGGGGGGAGAVGAVPGANNGAGGGNGFSSSISGSPVLYGPGGGGGANAGGGTFSGGTGGSTGGGTGGSLSGSAVTACSAGAPNTGAGGGGASNNGISPGTGCASGSGRVLVAYSPVTPKAPIDIGHNNASGVTGTCSINLTGGIVAGDLVIVTTQAVSGSPTNITVSTMSDGTNTYTLAKRQQDAGNVYDLEIWYKANAAAVANGGTITVTLSGTTNNNGCASQAVRAVGYSATPLDQTASQSATTATPSVTTGALSPVSELAYGVAWTTSQTGPTLPFTEDAAFTNINASLLVGNLNGYASNSYKLATSTAAITYAPTWNAAQLALTAIATFKGAP